jgi:hypothetical protein
VKIIPVNAVKKPTIKCNVVVILMTANVRKAAYAVTVVKSLTAVK